MLQDGFGLDGPSLYVGTEAAMAVMRYKVKSMTNKGKGKGKEGGTRQKQPLFKMGPVEDTFTTERRVAGRAQKTEDSETKAQPLFKIGPVEDAFTTERRAAGRAQKMEYPETKAQPLFKMGPVEDTFTTERRAAGRAQKMEGPETKAGSSASDHGCRGEAAPQPKWRSQYDLESQDSDGATPSPRSTLYRLESPPLSPSWGLPETSQQSPPPCTADCQQDEAAGDLPNRPPPIHTALLTPKTSPYSAELRTGYAPFFPEAVEARSNGLGERCSSYTALHTLAGSPKKGMRRSKSSIDCTCLPPRPRPGMGRVASVIDSYTPKTLEQFLETEEGEDADDEEPWPEHLCTPDMMLKSRSHPALRNLGGSKQSAQSSRGRGFMLYVNDEVPSILDSEDIMVPV